MGSCLALASQGCNHDYVTTHEELRGWFTGRLPQEWFEGPPEVTVDREEISVVGRLDGP